MKFAVAVAILVASCFISISAQTPSSADGWMRVESDDGRFSIEVPTEYKFVAYKTGFSLAHMGIAGSYDLSEPKYLATYVKGTLLSFESYKGSKGAAGEMLDQDSKHKTDPEKTTIKKQSVQIRQLSWTIKNTAVIRQYFSLKDNIYVLTAASRKGITPDMNRFLDSLRVIEKPAGVRSSNNVLFSQLINSEVKIDVDLSPLSPPAKAVKPPDDSEPVVIFLKPLAGYTDAARSSNVSGTIRIKVTFGADGWIPQMVIKKELPEGLLRQAVFSVLRIKFLPKEKDNKPQTVSLVFEYGFNIY